MKIQVKLFLVFIISGSLNSIQASITDALGQEAFKSTKIVGLSVGMGALLSATEMTAMYFKYRNSEDPFFLPWNDYKKAFYDGATSGIKFGLPLVAFSRVGWGNKLGAEHIIKPMTAAVGASFVTSRVSEAVNYSRGYNNPILANAVMDRNPKIAEKWPRRPINSAEDNDIMIKNQTASLTAYDYNQWLMPKVAVALGGGVLLYTAYQRYQNA